MFAATLSYAESRRLVVEDVPNHGRKSIWEAAPIASTSVRGAETLQMAVEFLVLYEWVSHWPSDIEALRNQSSAVTDFFISSGPQYARDTSLGQINGSYGA